jgi:hypothetical protein
MLSKLDGLLPKSIESGLIVGCDAAKFSSKNYLPGEENVMMGKQCCKQWKLFYSRLNLESRVRKDHPLRAINKIIDFHFIYDLDKDRYRHNGNVSVPPPVILKMMLLLIYYNVRSERELMDTIPDVWTGCGFLVTIWMMTFPTTAC